MPHEPDRFSPRGGPNTGTSNHHHNNNHPNPSERTAVLTLPKGDHVDILGRQSLNDLILRVAAGKGELIEETIVSDIREYSDRVKIFEE